MERRRALVLASVATAGLLGAVSIPLLAKGEPESALLAHGTLRAPDIEVISTGEQVDLSEHLKPSLLTMVEFTAGW